MDLTWLCLCMFTEVPVKCFLIIQFFKIQYGRESLERTLLEYFFENDHMDIMQYLLKDIANNDSPRKTTIICLMAAFYRS